MQRNMKMVDSFTKVYRISSVIKYVMDEKSAIIFAVD